MSDEPLALGPWWPSHSETPSLLPPPGFSGPLPHSPFQRTDSWLSLPGQRSLQTRSSPEEHTVRLKPDFMLLLTPELPECVYTHPEAVVPTAVCDLLTGDLPGVVLPEVPVKVVGIHVCLRGGEPHAAQTALVS